MEPDIKLPTVKKNARIGLLGGSFDPPHLGHSLLGLSFLSLEPIDELWVIPCANHAQKNVASDFFHRFAMCQIAFNKIKNVEVLDIEQHLQFPSYTIQTINYIFAKRPDLKLYLALGSDLTSSFDGWHQASEIIKKTTIVIFERAGYSLDIPKSMPQAHVHQGYSLPDVTSSSLRNFLNPANNSDKQPLLDAHVLDYIKKHQLYF